MPPVRPWWNGLAQRRAIASAWARPRPERTMLVLYSVGHSTRGEDEFVALLAAYGVRGVADVRTIPRSRRHPQFGAERLREMLEHYGIAHRHIPELPGTSGAHP